MDAWRCASASIGLRATKSTAIGFGDGNLSCQSEVLHVRCTSAPYATIMANSVPSIFLHKHA